LAGKPAKIVEKPKSIGRSACATVADLKFGHYMAQEKPKMPA
jgi:hypothetical protein